MFVTESEDEDFGAAVSISDEMVTEPFEVLASSPMGFRSDRLTEMAPLLVSNLHFPSSAQPIS